MEEINERALMFVVKYYKEGALDTKKAIKAFKRMTTGKKSLNARTVVMWKCLATAASLLLLMGITFSLYLSIVGKPTVVATTTNTLTVALPDSTKVTLAPFSSIKYSERDFLKQERSVEFEGKALFRVMHNALHPFIVYGEIGNVKVLGTVFQVDAHLKSRMNVALISGKVLFSAKDGAKGIMLTKGMSAQLGRGDSIPHIIPSQNSNETTWATKLFKFDNAPIGEVLKQLSKYYNVKLSTNDSEKKVSGEFEALELNEMISILEDMLDIKIKVVQ